MKYSTVYFLVLNKYTLYFNTNSVCASCVTEIVCMIADGSKTYYCSNNIPCQLC